MLMDLASGTVHRADRHQRRRKPELRPQRQAHHLRLARPGARRVDDHHAGWPHQGAAAVHRRRRARTGVGTVQPLGALQDNEMHETCERPSPSVLAAAAAGRGCGSKVPAAKKRTCRWKTRTRHAAGASAGGPAAGGAPQSQVATVERAGAAARRERAAHRLLRLRQLHHQGRVPRRDRAPAPSALAAPAQRARSRSRATPTSAAAASTTSRSARSAPRRWLRAMVLLGAHGRPARGRELRQGAPGRAGQRRGGVGQEPPRRDEGPADAKRLLVAGCVAGRRAPHRRRPQLFADNEARKAILELRANDEQHRGADLARA